VYEAALDWVAEILIAESARGVTSPAAALVLLHEYLRTGRPAVGAAAEQSLAAGLAAVPVEREAFARIEWLGVLRQARLFTDDPEIARVVDPLLPGAIDAVEQFRRAAYEPGEGLAGVRADAELRICSALLNAFELTGRLPYSMLAEELLHTSRRRLWRPESRRFGDDFGVNADALDVMCRVSALRHDDEYRARVVVAPGTEPLDDAAAMVEWMHGSYRGHPDAAARFALALIHWLALRALPN
jgi:hypothetical protein